MSLVTNHGTEHTRFYRKLLAKLSVFRRTQSHFFRAGRSNARKSLCHPCLSMTDSEYLPSSSGVEQPIGQVSEDHSNGPAPGPVEAPFMLGTGQVQEMPSQTDGLSPAERPTQIDPIEWYPCYMACLRHFLDVSQYSLPVRSVSAFINIHLPCQQWPNPIVWAFSSPGNTASPFVSLRHYIRRLVITGHDTPSVLCAFFSDDWVAGVQCIWKQERMNYLFTAKSCGWAETKATYDVLPCEHTPFIQPLRDPTEEELRSAETRWSEWLAMEDWMVGPRSPWE